MSERWKICRPRTDALDILFIYNNSARKGGKLVMSDQGRSNKSRKHLIHVRQEERIERSSLI